MIPTHHKKRNMVLDSMRLSGGRCPPLIATLLVLACLVLIFNWWSLSTENVELINQLDQLQDQLKRTLEDRDKFSVLKVNFEQQYKNAQSELGLLHVRLQKLNDLKKHNDELSDDLTICKSEVDSMSKLDLTKTATLEAQRLEKDGLISQLDTKRDETLQLKSELNKTKIEMEQLRQTCTKNTGKEIEDDNGEKDVSNVDDLRIIENEEKEAAENIDKNMSSVKFEKQSYPKTDNPQPLNFN